MRDRSPTPGPAKWRRRLRKMLLVLAALMASYILMGLVFRLLLWHEMSSIRREGNPTSLARLSVVPPNSRNAAPIYVRACALTRKSQKMWYLDSEIELRKNPKVWDQAWAEAPRFREAIKLVRKAGLMPECRYRYDWETGSMPYNYRIHTLAGLLRNYAILLGHKRRGDEASQALELSVQTADSLRSQPLFFPLLDRAEARSKAAEVAFGLVAEGLVSEKEAEALCRNLDYRPIKNEIPDMWRWERASVCQTFDRAARTGHPYPTLKDIELDPLMQFECSLLGRPVLWADEYFQLRAMRRTVRDADLPFRRLPKPDQSRAGCPWHQSCPAASPLAFSQMMWVDLHLYGWRRSFDTHEARVNGARTAIALRIYRQRFHAYPRRLADLRKLGWRLNSIDPFTGHPLEYRPRENGCIIYSWGPNLKDDHGHRPIVNHALNDEGDIVWVTGN